MANNSRKPRRRSDDKRDKRREYRKNDEECDNRKDDRKEDGRKGRLSPLNDISWYNKNPALLAAVSKIPFPYRPGMEIPIIDVSQGTTPVPQGTYTIPGVYKIRWAPYIGTESVNPTADPINVAGREVFNRVRSAFSGSLDADAPDFMVYFMALDSIFSYIGYMKRIFRIIGTYTPDNHVIPDKLLAAFFPSNQSVVNSLLEDKMKLFQYINELVHMTDKFVCPALFDVFNRHYWLSDNVYADAASLNSQLYVFVPQSLCRFAMQNIGTEEAPIYVGGCQYDTVPTAPATGSSMVETMYMFATNMINALSSWDDAFIISGYLRRAFEGAPAFKVDEIAYTEPFAPVYVPEVLAQIENAFSCVGVTANILLTALTQDPTTNTIKTNLTVSPLSTAKYYPKPYINLRMDVPDEASCVEATRMQNWYNPTTKEWIAGTEIIFGSNYSMGNTLNYSMVNQVRTPDSQATVWAQLKQIADVDCFDWHPFAFSFSLNSQGAIQSCAISGDVANFTTFDYEVAKQLNRVCLFSEFNAFGID